MSLQGKIAVVTGASRGLGQRVAFTLAAQGIRVALVARSERLLHEAVQQINAKGGIASAVMADIADTRSVEHIKAEVEKALGAPSILVNGAGVFGPIQLIKDSDPKQWIDTMTINMISPYLLCRAFVNGMIEAGWGRIVNFTSAAALHPPGPLNSAYATSKVAQDYLGLQYFLGRQLDVVRLRTFNLIGPGQSDRFAIGSFGKQIVELRWGIH